MTTLPDIALTGISTLTFNELIDKLKEESLTETKNEIKNEIKMVPLTTLTTLSSTAEPNVEILSITEDQIQAKFTGVTREYMNSLRRVCLNDIDCFCAHELKLFINTSQMDDEQLAHRLGQIPFTSQAIDQFVYPDQCDCGNICEKCGVKYSCRVLNVDEKQIREVTSQDLQLVDKNAVTLTVKPAYTFNEDSANVKTNTKVDVDANTNTKQDCIIICQLQPREEIHFEIYLRKSNTLRANHHKHQTCGLVGIKNPAIVKMDHEKLKLLTSQQRAKIARYDTTFVYDSKEDILKVADDPNNSLVCQHNPICEEMVHEFGQPGAIKLYDRTDYFLMTIESAGFFKPRELLIRCLKTFYSMLQEAHLNLALC